MSIEGSVLFFLLSFCAIRRSWEERSSWVRRFPDSFQIAQQSRPGWINCWKRSFGKNVRVEKYCFPRLSRGAKKVESPVEPLSCCNLKEREREREMYRFDLIGCDRGSNASQLDLIGTNNYSPSSRSGVEKARFQCSSSSRE